MAIGLLPAIIAFISPGTDFGRNTIAVREHPREELYETLTVSRLMSGVISRVSCVKFSVSWIFS